MAGPPPPPPPELRPPRSAADARDLAEQTLDGTLPYEETWRENARNVLSLLREVERLRGERIITDSTKTRDLGNRVREGLTIMRDADDDEDSWLLPDVATVSRAMSALGALVQQAEHRDRFKIALERIGKEWTDRSGSPDDVRQFACSVIAGGSARTPLAQAKGADVAA